jgi:hypothetical protein
MPRNPIDYSKTIFYKIVCKDITITDLYVGSTTDFKARKGNHKSKCNNVTEPTYNFKVYQFMRENGGWENWDMVMIHRQSCVDKLEAHKMERGFIETFGATLNSCVPSRTGKEWYGDNKDRVRDIQAVYKETIKDKTKEYAIKYRDEHRESNRLASIEWRKNNIDDVREKAKLTYEKNKDSIREKNALYRELNAERIKEQKALNYETNKNLINTKRREANAMKKLLKQESLGVLI